jgi:DNA-dependent RNA polymerase auxiliary subunit epsilon
MKKYFNILLAIAGLLLLSTSCIKDLDTVPIDPDVISSANVFDDTAAYKQNLSKLYAGLAVSGQTGPSGNPDIAGIDEGFGQYLRGYWYCQELTTDESLIGWNDQTVKNFHYQNWGASDVFIGAMYYRIFYQICATNQFVRETTPDLLSDRGVSGQLLENINYYIAEARFLRALSYYHAMDMFANTPFVTENDPVGAFFPPQYTRAQLFDFIQSELLAIEPLLLPARQNEYGRADQGAAWMLLAKLYLNAEVYIGQPKYTECLTYCNKLINAGYTLEATYQNLFLADNNVSNPEIIFPINFDGAFTKTWGGTTFVIHASVGGSMDPVDFGVDGGWGGLRTTPEFVGKFNDITGETDTRAMFYTDGQSLEINDVGLFTDGYAITKFKNVDQNGNAGSNLTHCDTDFPLFRLADVYLMYAEAVLRGGSGGDLASALNYINLIRERAYNGTDGDITSVELTLPFILNERARELYWEGHRRTDLVRFGLFTGNQYVWSWKGEVQSGIGTDSKYNIFPIPSSDVNANSNLQQNPGY